MSRPKSFWQKYAWVGVAMLCVLVYMMLESTWLKDTLAGWGYEPSAKMAEIEEDLELTATGKRVFRATQPLVEGSEDFNAHCGNHDVEVSLLGCYTDGRIYIYAIELSELSSANKVTAAHELLHAVWERMGNGEQRQVSAWLQQLYNEKREWFDSELEVYSEGDRMEEMYTRAGTKLADLPKELEEHYAKYFQNRGAIVEFYQDYEAPFLALQSEMEELSQQIQRVSQEIEAERVEYLRDVTSLDARIDQFNACADTAGCFASQTEFDRKRQALLTERANLEVRREELNQKIDENNQRVQDYRERQVRLGRLSDAMNSNVQLVEVIDKYE